MNETTPQLRAGGGRGKLAGSSRRDALINYAYLLSLFDPNPLYPSSPHASSSWWNRAARRVIGNQYSYPTLETFLAWRKSDRDPSSTAKKLPLAKEELSLTSPYLRALIISFLHRAIRFALFRAALNRIPPPPLPSCTPPLREKAAEVGFSNRRREGRDRGTGLEGIFYFYRRHFFLSPGQPCKIEFVRSRMEIVPFPFENKENRCSFFGAFVKERLSSIFYRHSISWIGQYRWFNMAVFSLARGRTFNRGKLDPLGVFRFFTMPRSYCIPERNLRRKKLIWISCTDFFKSSPAFMAHYFLAFTSRLPPRPCIFICLNLAGLVV